MASLLLQRDPIPAVFVLDLLRTPRVCVFCGLPIEPQRGWCYFESQFSIAFMCLSCETLSGQCEPQPFHVVETTPCP